MMCCKMTVCIENIFGHLWEMLSAPSVRFCPKPTLALNSVLSVGDAVTKTFTINKDHCPPGFSGDLIPTSLIVDRLEAASSRFLESNLTGNHTSVGYFVDFEHKKWPKIGSSVIVDAKVTKVDARKATFDIKVKDELGELIGSGTHGRAIIKFD